MRRRKDDRVRSSAGQVGSHGVRKSRLASRKARPFGTIGHLRARRTTPSPVIAGIRSEELTVRKNAMGDPLSDNSGRTMESESLSVHCARRRYPLHAARRTRLSAIVAALSSPPPGPRAATAGRPRAIRRPAAQHSRPSQLRSSQRARRAESGDPSGASGAQAARRAHLELSSAISRPAFICALRVRLPPH